jgi:hypothetical protein
MDFTKFVSMLESSSLYFSRVDRLGDPFEGSYSKGNINLRPVVYKDAKGTEMMFERMARFAKWVREWTLVNCWHMNAHESPAMWKLYAKSNEAIAVQSTYATLVTCLPSNVFVGCVQYIDYDRDWLPEGNTFYPFIHKRKSFEHEREARAVIQELPIENGSIATGKTNPGFGQHIKIDLAALVQSVCVAPMAPSWFRDLTEAICRKYGQNWNVTKSSLDAEPVY